MCEVPRGVLSRGLRFHCSRYVTFFLNINWLDTFRTDYVFVTSPNFEIKTYKIESIFLNHALFSIQYFLLNP